MQWLKQLSDAIDYIENNLENEISFDKAAEIACCSKFYFQRMFSYVAGITLSEYIRRRKMTKAAFDLQTTDLKISEIGAKYGYDSPTSFNRAFQKVHNIAPSVVRSENTQLNAYPRIRFSVQVTGNECMKYRIESKESFRIVGKRVNLKDDIEENFNIIPNFWEKIIDDNTLEKIIGISNKNPDGVLGVSIYENPKDIYYFIAASSNKDTPDDFYEYEIPTATWVVFECDGKFPDSIQDIFKRFFTEWLPFSGFEYAHLPDIELYPQNKYENKTGYSEIWISIKKENNV